MAEDGTFDPYQADTDLARNAGKGKIQSLILPNNATSIPAGPSAWGTFKNFDLQAVSGAHITTIGNYAFYNCSNLTTVSIPAVTTIGNNAFSSCSNLTTVNMPAVTTIGNYAFSGCSNLTTVSMSAVTTIGNYAFSSCSNLTTISIPVVTTIKSSAFYGCSNLTTVSMPLITTIGNSAFYNCSNLTSVSLPTAATINDRAFSGCRNAIFTVIGSSVLSTGDNGKMLIKDTNTLLAYSLPPNDITLSPNITNIAAEVFKAVDNLISFTAEGVLSIGEYAFTNCASLATVDLTEATSIGNSAFSRCTSLAAINLPKAASIVNGTFSYTGTTALTVTLGAAPPTLGINIFVNVSSTKDVTVKVPSDNLTLYSDGYENSINSVNNWGNAFRGKGWSGGSTYLNGYANTFINLTLMADN